MSYQVRLPRWPASLCGHALLFSALFMHAAVAAPPERATRNIVVMISDGCGFNQVYAADLYDFGTTGTRQYQQFPMVLAMSTYPHGGSYDPAQAWAFFDYVRANPTDSAAAATAMSTGKKTYNGAIGMIGPTSAKAVRGKHAMDYAEEKGMATGVVTSVEWSHATPAGFVAHNSGRGSYAAIAVEMLTSTSTDLIMGCGHPWYDNNGQRLSTPNTFDFVGGEATWNALTSGTLAAGDADGDGQPDPWTLIQSRSEFKALAAAANPPKRLIGVPQVFETLQQRRIDSRGDRSGLYADDPPGAVPFTSGVPTLAEMSRGALNVLSRDPDGFMLMIEGGAVDWSGHANLKGRLIEEERDFNAAIDVVIEWIEGNGGFAENALIITGDHETGFLWGPDSGRDFDPLVNKGRGQMPGMKFNSSGHTNSLIPFFANGPAILGAWVGAMAEQIDLRRGRYLDNSEMGQILIGLINDSPVTVTLSCKPGWIDAPI